MTLSGAERVRLEFRPGRLPRHHRENLGFFRKPSQRNANRPVRGSYHGSIRLGGLTMTLSGAERARLEFRPGRLPGHHRENLGFLWVAASAAT
jgi:hypothetical protein